jgi:Na+/melibiose symporter-like transporter
MGMPLWLRLVQRLGLVRSWGLGMLMAVLVFVWAFAVEPGDEWLFVLICALGGVALGADLALPGALLAGLIGALGQRGQGEGVYFGWWSLVNKLNLALAAGLTLPLLAWWGYTPGGRDPQALQALTWVYCGAPCVLKLMAGTMLMRWLRHDSAFSSSSDTLVKP